MEEPTVKKEIIVKRLSAFKFAVEFNTKSSLVRRQSVIQKAPPSPAFVENQVAPQPIPIKLVILESIVEILLCKLLGQKRLQEFCGYPQSSTCMLLRKVIHLSRASNQSANKTATECNGTVQCFLEQVNEFLKICAPTEQLWKRFGWHLLSEEAILRKIFDEEISASIRWSDPQDANILKIYDDTQLLLLRERQGFTAISPAFTRSKSAQNKFPVSNNKILSRGGEKFIHGKNFYKHQKNPPTWSSPVRPQQAHAIRFVPYSHGKMNDRYLESERNHHQAFVAARHY